MTSASLALAACAGLSEPTTDPTLGDDTHVEPTTDTTATQGTSIPQASSECVDPTGDAAVGDIAAVELTSDADNLHVTWTLTQNEIESGTTGFYLSLASEDGMAAGQLGIKYLDGQQIAYFTFDGTNREISATAQVTPTTVAGTFRLADLQPYGTNFKWHATTTKDGADVDACPDPSGDILNPATVRFGE